MGATRNTQRTLRQAAGSHRPNAGIFGPSGLFLDGMNINGSRVLSTLRYLGSGSTGASWTAEAGSALTRTAGATTPDIGQSTPYNSPCDVSVAFKGSTNPYYQGADEGDPLTADIAIFAVVEVVAGATNPMIAAKNGWAAGSYQGWFFRLNTLEEFEFCLLKTTGPGIYLRSNAVTAAWHTVSIFIDRDEGTAAQASRIYVDGADQTKAAQSFTAEAPSIDVAAVFTLGNVPGNSHGFTGELAAFELYLKDGWFAGGASNPTDWAAADAARFAGLT